MAEAELNENPETRHIEIQTLRERLSQFPGKETVSEQPWVFTIQISNFVHFKILLILKKKSV
jgi:hypothetical protein